MANAIEVWKRRDSHSEFWHKLNQLTEQIKVYKDRLESSVKDKKNRSAKKCRKRRTSNNLPRLNRTHRMSTKTLGSTEFNTNN